MSRVCYSDPANDKQSAADLILSEFLPYRIVVLGDLISRRLSRAYEGENLTIPEWRVLAVISQAETMAARDVVMRTPMDKMAVSRAVSSLEAKGLVKRAVDARDKRVTAVALSTRGRALFARVARTALGYEARLLSALGAEELAAFKASIEKLEAIAGSVPVDGLSVPSNSG